MSFDFMIEKTIQLFSFFPFPENHVNCESLTTEGAAWILDLAHIDSTWMLPLLLGIITLGNFEVNPHFVFFCT